MQALFSADFLFPSNLYCLIGQIWDTTFSLRWLVLSIWHVVELFVKIIKSLIHVETFIPHVQHKVNFMWILYNKMGVGRSLKWQILLFKHSFLSNISFFYHEHSKQTYFSDFLLLGSLTVEIWPVSSFIPQVMMRQELWYNKSVINTMGLTLYTVANLPSTSALSGTDLPPLNGPIKGLYSGLVPHWLFMHTEFARIWVTSWQPFPLHWKPLDCYKNVYTCVEQVKYYIYLCDTVKPHTSSSSLLSHVTLCRSKMAAVVFWRIIASYFSFCFILGRKLANERLFGGAVSRYPPHTGVLVFILKTIKTDTYLLDELDYAYLVLIQAS